MDAIETMYAIETRKLTKKFNLIIAVDSLDLQVEKGKVFGFLGPNGAGKTTTLRMLMSFATPTSGDAFILGERVDSKAGNYRKSIGYVPDVPAFYPWMRAYEFMIFSGQLAGMGGKELQSKVNELLEIAGLTGVKTKIGGFSRGMKQRLGIAQALITDPSVVMLDEPTSALDPIGRKEVLNMIGHFSGKTTVLFSTHILADVERVCDTVAILNNGKLITQEPISSLKDKYIESAISIRVVGDTGSFIKAIQEYEWIEKVDSVEKHDQALRVIVKDLPVAQKVLPQVIGRMGLELKEFQTGEVNLEDIFVRLVNSSEA